MTLFTTKELQSLLDIADVQSTMLVARILGKDALTDMDILMLKNAGLDFNKISSKLPPYYQSYIFGRLVGNLSEKQLKTLDFKDFQLYLNKGQFEKPTRREIEEYNMSQRRTYSYIKGMGQRWRETISAKVGQAEMEYLANQRHEKELGVIKEKIADGKLRRKSVQRIASDIGNEMKSWDKDWSRIVETECQGIYNLGIAQTYMKDYGIESKVYYDVFPGACRHCIALYLTGGIGSEPKTFTISQLMSYGNNIGRKVADWKPSLYAIHPHCRCQPQHLPDGYIWSQEEKQFIPNPNFERKIERKSKIKIIVGTKQFEV